MGEVADRGLRVRGRPERETGRGQQGWGRASDTSSQQRARQELLSRVGGEFDSSSALVLPETVARRGQRESISTLTVIILE